ncbi:MAG: endolytic transglycosylase MltG [Rhodoblastus sp.]|nr:MAG: endolytic transglycosylase MltG [Rhodoblastus sp.]
MRRARWLPTRSCSSRPAPASPTFSTRLEREGVIADSTILRVAVYLQNLQSKVRAGEFAFKANSSPKDALNVLLTGKSIQHALTIPEGLTSEQIVQRVRDNDVLVGEVRETPKEGMLAPNTYNFSRGTTREKFLALMREQQRAFSKRSGRSARRTCRSNRATSF